MATTPLKTTSNAAPAARYVLPDEMKGVEFMRTEYRFTPQKAVTIEDLVKPRAWAHVADKLRAGDVIEAVAPDLSWCVRLLVRHVQSPEVFVGVISESRFEQLPEKVAA